MASTPMQKGITRYLMSREGTNQTLRNHAAKKAVSKLSSQASLSGVDSLGQVYLALAYLELYVSQQEMLKKKTEVSLIMSFINLFIFILVRFFYYAGRDGFFGTTYQERFKCGGTSWRGRISHV